MRFWLLVICFFVVHTSLKSLAASRPEISVLSNPETVVAAGLPVLLSDIGGAGFVHVSLIAKAGELQILEPLADNETKTFTNAELVRIIKEKVASHPDLLAQKWTYFVPENVKIVGRKNHISVNRLSASVLQTLAQKCESCSFKLSSIKIPEVKETTPFIAMDLETSPLKLSGSFLLPLRLTFAGGVEKVYYITGQITGKGKALAATRALMMGEKITSSDVREQETDLNYTNDAFATSEDLEGKTAGRMIQMGRVIYKSDLKRESVVQRGQVIRVISGNDAFEVSTQMMAEDNGAIGDQVRLKNPETLKLMSGRVVDRGVVRVQ